MTWLRESQSSCGYGLVGITVHFMSYMRSNKQMSLLRSGIKTRAQIANLKHVQRIEQERAERFKVIEERWEAFKDLELGDVEAEVAKVVAEVRADIRAEREATKQRA
jgi:hypothetical protein